MASTPLYASKGYAFVAAVSTANTNRDGTGTIVDITGTAPTNGYRVNRIQFKSTGDLADSLLFLYTHNGTSYFLYDEIDLGNPAAGTTGLEAYGSGKRYEDLILPSGWKMGASITVAPTAGVLNVMVQGVDLT